MGKGDVPLVVVTLLWLHIIQLLMLSRDRPWLSPWLISYELDIIIHVIALHLSGHCDGIDNRLGCLQQNVDRARATHGRYVRIEGRRFIVVYGFVMSCKQCNKICTLVTICRCAHSCDIWCLFPLLLRNAGINHQNNTLVKHSSTCIILYSLWDISKVLKYMLNMLFTRHSGCGHYNIICSTGTIRILTDSREY